MSQIRVSSAARKDLDEIWFYIASDNPDAADRYVRSLISRFPLLASMPHIGRLREELAPRVRSLPVGRHVIFYFPMEDGVEIVRVLHGSRDLPPLLG